MDDNMRWWFDYDFDEDDNDDDNDDVDDDNNDIDDGIDDVPFFLASADRYEECTIQGRTLCGEDSHTRNRYFDR